MALEGDVDVVTAGDEVDEVVDGDEREVRRVEVRTLRHGLDEAVDVRGAKLRGAPVVDAEGVVRREQGPGLGLERLEALIEATFVLGEPDVAAVLLDEGLAAEVVGVGLDGRLQHGRIRLGRAGRAQATR